MPRCDGLGAELDATRASDSDALLAAMRELQSLLVDAEPCRVALSLGAIRVLLSLMHGASPRALC